MASRTHVHVVERHVEGALQTNTVGTDQGTADATIAWIRRVHPVQVTCKSVTKQPRRQHGHQVSCPHASWNQPLSQHLHCGNGRRRFHVPDYLPHTHRELMEPRQDISIEGNAMGNDVAGGCRGEAQGGERGPRTARRREIAPVSTA